MNKHQARILYRIGKYHQRLSRRRGHFISFIPEHNALWYRVPKAATRSINHMLETACPESYIYGGNEVILPDLAVEKAFKFGFTRNPVNRMVSLWRNKIIKKLDLDLGDVNRDELMDFDNFIAWLTDQDLDYGDPHFRKQIHFLDVHKMDFIGQLEHFERDWNGVVNQLGLETTEQLVHRNVTNSASFSPTTSQAHRIARLFAEDVEAFYPSEF